MTGTEGRTLDNSALSAYAVEYGYDAITNVTGESDETIRLFLQSKLDARIEGLKPQSLLLDTPSTYKINLPADKQLLHFIQAANNTTFVNANPSFVSAMHLTKPKGFVYNFYESDQEIRKEIRKFI